VALIAKRSQKVAGGWSAAETPGIDFHNAVHPEGMPELRESGIPSGRIVLRLEIRGAPLRCDPRLLSGIAPRCVFRALVAED